VKGRGVGKKRPVRRRRPEEYVILRGRSQTGKLVRRKRCQKRKKTEQTLRPSKPNEIVSRIDPLQGDSDRKTTGKLEMISGYARSATMRVPGSDKELVRRGRPEDRKG